MEKLYILKIIDNFKYVGISIYHWNALHWDYTRKSTEFTDHLQGYTNEFGYRKKWTIEILWTIIAGREFSDVVRIFKLDYICIYIIILFDQHKFSRSCTKLQKFSQINSRLLMKISKWETSTILFV